MVDDVAQPRKTAKLRRGSRLALVAVTVLVVVAVVAGFIVWLQKSSESRALAAWDSAADEAAQAYVNLVAVSNVVYVLGTGLDDAVRDRELGITVRVSDAAQQSLDMADQFLADNPQFSAGDAGPLLATADAISVPDLTARFLPTALAVQDAQSSHTVMVAAEVKADELGVEDYQGEGATLSFEPATEAFQKEPAPSKEQIEQLTQWADDMNTQRTALLDVTDKGLDEVYAKALDKAVAELDEIGRDLARDTKDAKEYAKSIKGSVSDTSTLEALEEAIKRAEELDAAHPDMRMLGVVESTTVAEREALIALKLAVDTEETPITE